MSFLYKIYILSLSVFLSNSAFSKDIKLPENPLLYKDFLSSDYMLVIEGDNLSYANSETVKKYNANIESLSSRASTAGFPSDHLTVVDILPPDTKFTVKEVFYKKPSFMKSLFSSGHNFAVVESNGEKYTVAPVSHINDVWYIYDFERNNCQKMRLCKNWRSVIEQCLDKQNGPYCHVFFRLYIKDDNSRIVWDKNIRPPYKKSWVDKSMNAFSVYAEQKKLDVILDKSHLTVRGRLTAVELADVFLHYEKLNIKNVSLWEKLENR